MFFYNEVEQWNNVSDSDLVQASSDGKKFIKRNYFDSVICKFTPNSFKVDRIFSIYRLCILIIYYLKVLI